ncbi:MAG: NAD-dependent epimerase/dehydratase family protein [Patescibacteria group bacterium]
MIKKVLVVGGAGYIGGCVTDSLLAKRVPFTVYDNLTYENHYLKPVDFIYGDVRDKTTLKKILPKYSHVIWLAAIVGDAACAIKPELTKEVNQYAVGFLAQHFKGRIIFTSTCSVYGKNSRPVSETSPTNPLSVYAQTKLEAEKYLYKKNALIFRIGTAFGLSDNYSRIRMDLAINYMTMNAVKFGKLTIYGGQQWRPFIHVRDIGQIIVDNLTTPYQGVYNLTTSNATVISVGRKIAKITGCKIVVTEQKYEDQRSYYALTAEGLKDKVFKKTTKYTVTYGIREITQLVLSHRIKNLDLEYYSNAKYLLTAIEQYEKGF